MPAASTTAYCECESELVGIELRVFVLRELIARSYRRGDTARAARCRARLIRMGYSPW